MVTFRVDNKPALSVETFRKLRDIVAERCGIYFADNKRYLLEKRLLRRLEQRNLKSFEDYLYFLTYDSARELEYKNLFNVVVTNETSFFRDPVQLDVFRKGVLPKVIEEKSRMNDKTLRLWSAACSTGEEPLTLAMILLEEGLLNKGWTIDIIGSDISNTVLDAAMKGRYENYSVRNTPERILNKYFVKNGHSYIVKGTVNSLVKFKRINLIDSSETRMVRRRDIVFCRNVLIYFNDDTKKRVINHIYDSLVKGGYLFVGFSESLHNITRLFRPVSIKNSVVYQKV